jgi:hypothetical protein
MTLAKLFILDKEIELLWTDMNYHREIRMNGKPATDVIGGLITLCFATDRDTDIILKWMTKENEDNTWNEADKMEEGKVCFYENGFDYPPTKTYEFNDAHLIYFKESFYAEGEEPMQTTITISPAIQNYGVEFVKRWNVSWIPPSERMAYQPKENLTEEVIDCYLTDLNNNEKNDFGFEEEVYLVVKTRNMIGQTKDIDLSNFNKTFEYNDEVLKDNVLEKFNIKEATQKVKLKVVKPQDKIITLEN